MGGEGYWADIQALGQAVLAAAEAAGDQVALGWTHAIIGRSGGFTGAHDEGRAHLARALDHFRCAGDLSGQASAHLFASYLDSLKRDWAEAITRGGQALALFRRTGDQAGQGWALAVLGDCHARLENYELARGYARQVLEVTPRGRRPDHVRYGVGHAGLGALPARRAPSGDHLLPAGPGLLARAEAAAGPPDADHHAARVRRCLPGRR